MTTKNQPRPELLAPAGEPEAGYAAFHYGADAIYAGLQRFSARAEAVNFSPDELDAITAYAHSLTPRRNVYVTLNTLLHEEEIPAIIESLAVAAQCEVDAIIVQDLGIARLIKKHFPLLRLHASTQLAIHNLAGAHAAAETGFRRVTLARELTLAEIQTITQHAPIETEAFIHGALCYSYSGLCLYSSLLRGRSGNRGQCQYPCRDSFITPGRPQRIFPFSMKDLSTPNDVLQELNKAGVASLKIEGRKKSPLYVAAVTDYYRRLLDGRMTAAEAQALAKDIQTIFSRPTTSLYFRSRKNGAVIDSEIVGHRGTPIGTVMSANRHWLRFKTSRALECHDGLQIDLPNTDRPYGFSVDQIRFVNQKGPARPIFTVPANSLIEVSLLPEHPLLPDGATIYCSSSQEVKRRYKYEKPKSGLYRQRQPVDFQIQITAEGITATATSANYSAASQLPGPFAPARQSSALDATIQTAFSKLGETPLQLGKIAIANPSQCFVPVSVLNELRRTATTALLETIASESKKKLGEMVREETDINDQTDQQPATVAVKIDRSAYLTTLLGANMPVWREIIIDIARDDLNEIEASLATLAEEQKGLIRLALPIISRGWDEKDLVAKIQHFLAQGWKKWQIANISGLNYLPKGLDISGDWPLYVQNHLAIAELHGLGVKEFTISPELNLHQIKKLPQKKDLVFIVYQDQPLFISENCVQAAIAPDGRCLGAKCQFQELSMESSHSEEVLVVNQRCRNITIPQTASRHFEAIPQLQAAGITKLRLDFLYRSYSAEEIGTVVQEATPNK